VSRVVQEKYAELLHLVLDRITYVPDAEVSESKKVETKREKWSREGNSIKSDIYQTDSQTVVTVDAQAGAHEILERKTSALSILMAELVHDNAGQSVQLSPSSQAAYIKHIRPQHQPDALTTLLNSPELTSGGELAVEAAETEAAPPAALPAGSSEGLRRWFRPTHEIVPMADAQVREEEPIKPAKSRSRRMSFVERMADDVSKRESWFNGAAGEGEANQPKSSSIEEGQANQPKSRPASKARSRRHSVSGGNGGGIENLNKSKPTNKARPRRRSTSSLLHLQPKRRSTALKLEVDTGTLVRESPSKSVDKSQHASVSYHDPENTMQELAQEHLKENALCVSIEETTGGLEAWLEVGVKQEPDDDSGDLGLAVDNASRKAAGRSRTRSRRKSLSNPDNQNKKLAHCVSVVNSAVADSKEEVTTHKPKRRPPPVCSDSSFAREAERDEQPLSPLSPAQLIRADMQRQHTRVCSNSPNNTT